MVRYLKYIVIVFTLIGVLVGGFFFAQNKVDIMAAMEHSDKFEYDYLKENCQREIDDYLFPCIKSELKNYLSHVSLTGTGIGMKMAFNLIDEDRERTSLFKENQDLKSFTYTVNFLEINNLALENVYKRYHGFDALYGGYIASLERYNDKGHRFSQDLINGLESPDGFDKLSDSEDKAALKQRFDAAKKEFYRIKGESKAFIESEFKRLQAIQEKL